MKNLIVLSALSFFASVTLLAQNQEEVKKHVKIITIDENGKKIVKEYENGDEDEIEWSTNEGEVKIIVRKGGDEEEIIVGNMPAQMKWSMVKSSNKGFLGVFLSDNNSQNKGAIITGLVDDAPAAKAGLKKGDVITSVNGVTVTNNQSLSEALSGFKAGDEVTLTYLRSGDEESVKITLSKRAEEDMFMMMPGMDKEIIVEIDEEGMQYNEFFDEKRAFLGIEPAQDVDDIDGVMIMKTTKQSAAQKAGLQTGDVITKIGEKTISNFDDLKAALESKKPGDEITIQYSRQGKKRNATVELTSMAEVMSLEKKRVIIEEIEED